MFRQELLIKQVLHVFFLLQILTYFIFDPLSFYPIKNNLYNSCPPPGEIVDYLRMTEERIRMTEDQQERRRKSVNNKEIFSPGFPGMEDEQVGGICGRKFRRK